MPISIELVSRKLGFPGGSESKASACSAGDLGSIPGLGRSPGEGNGNPLQYSCLENPMDGGAWWATVHRVAKSCTIPLGHPSALAPSIQYRALNLDWLLVSYMILYMFQCYSPRSSHPLPLQQSPIDCSIHQCLFCCLVYRVIVAIFLNSIYMC